MYLLFLIITLIVFLKYHIDTKSTIKELIKDRNMFRQHNWTLIRDKTREKDALDQVSQPYHQLKGKIDLLIKDLNDTDFSNFDDIKQEVISALSEIDSYGDSNDQG
jgi:hypothetical protein